MGENITPATQEFPDVEIQQVTEDNDGEEEVETS